MPYIKQERRNELDLEIDILIEKAQRVGELNYIITRILDGHISKFASSKGIDYGAINAIIGVLECAKMEFYQRVAIPYERRKLEENGDVFVEHLSKAEQQELKRVANKYGL